MAIPAAFFAALAEIPAIAAATEETLNLVSSISQAKQVSRIEAQTTATLFTLQSPYTGLAAILSTLQDIQRQLVTLGAPQQAGRPVTLPSNPPPAYGGPSSSTIAADVWAFPDPNTGQPVVDLLADAGLLAINMTTAQVGMIAIGNPPWVGAGSWTSTSGPMRPDLDLPVADVSTILATDATITDWLNRAYPGTGAFDNGNGWAVVSDTLGGLQWVYWLSPQDFEAIKAGLTPATALNVPPVWPGLAKVTLGAAVPISANFAITAAMDGVIVAITGAPVGASYFTFSPDKSYRALGAICFVSDNGQLEYPQLLGLTSGLYTPKSMAHAEGCQIRTSGGTTGTVTPFTINP